MDKLQDEIILFARKHTNLKKIFKNLQSLNEGELFIPIQVLQVSGKIDRFLLLEAFKRYSEEEKFAFLRMCPQDINFPSHDLEEEFIEKLLTAGFNKKNRSVQRITKQLLSPKKVIAFETDQAVLIYSKEKLQHYELWLKLLTILEFDLPLLVFIENAHQLGSTFKGLLFYLARNIYFRQKALRKGDQWPRMCFLMLDGEGGKTESTDQLFKDSPFISFDEFLNKDKTEIEILVKDINKNISRELNSSRTKEKNLMLFPALISEPIGLNYWREASGLSYGTFNRILKKLKKKGLVYVYGSKGGKKAELPSEILKDFLLKEKGALERQTIHLQLAEAFGSMNHNSYSCAFHFLSAGERKKGVAAALSALEFFRKEGSQEKTGAFLHYLIRSFEDQIAEEKFILLRHDLAELYTLQAKYTEAMELLGENLKDYEKNGNLVQAATTKLAIGILQANMGQMDEAFSTLSEASEVLVDKKEQYYDYLRLQLVLSRINLEKGKFDRALEIAQKTLELVKTNYKDTSKWQRIEALTNSRLGSIYNSVSSFEKAQEAYEASYQKFQLFPDSLEKGGLCCNLGNLYINLGKYCLAEKYYFRAASLARAIGAKELLALVEANLCILYANQWKLEQAEEHIQSSLTSAEDVGSSRYIKFAMMCLATLRCRQGRFSESIRIFTSECEQVRRSNDRYLLMNNLFQIVYPYMETGNWSEALQAVDEASKIAKDLSWPRGILEGELTSGQINVRLGIWTEAEKHLQNARNASWSHHGQIDAELDELEGHVALGKGQHKKAAQLLRRSYSSFKKLNASVRAVRCRLDLVKVLLESGNAVKASVEIETIWDALLESSSNKRSPVVWIRAAILKSEILFTGKRKKRNIWQKQLYELVEALARGRELGMMSEIWIILTHLALVSEKLKDRERTRQYVKESEKAVIEYLQEIPEEAQSILLKGKTFERLKKLVKKYLGKKLAFQGESFRSKKNAQKKKKVRGTKRKNQSERLPDVSVGFYGIVGQSPPMLEVFNLIERVASSDLPVLISGESGTGKELVARAIHNLSSCSKGKFVAENCAAIPEQLAESELFGYKKGAFAGAQRDRKGMIETASSGTLFLDKIEDLPLAVQAKLLRVLADGKFRPLGSLEARESHFRLITTASCDLRGEVERGAFRADLFYRILGIEIRLPSLQERKEDIEELIFHFLRKYTQRKKSVPRLTTAAKQTLIHYSWPGNIRELENEIRRLVLLELEVIHPGDLRVGLKKSQYELVNKGFVHRYNFPEAQSLLEKEYLLQALEECNGVISHVAKLLEMNRRSVYKMMDRLGIGNL